jgi:hypothetical protein
LCGAEKSSITEKWTASEIRDKWRRILKAKAAAAASATSTTVAVTVVVIAAMEAGARAVEAEDREGMSRNDLFAVSSAEGAGAVDHGQRMADDAATLLEDIDDIL